MTTRRERVVMSRCLSQKKVRPSLSCALLIRLAIAFSSKFGRDGLNNPSLFLVLGHAFRCHLRSAPNGPFPKTASGALPGAWPRNNTPRIGRDLTAQGRDAADVPITQTFGPNTPRQLQSLDPRAAVGDLAAASTCRLGGEIRFASLSARCAATSSTSSRHPLAFAGDMRVLRPPPQPKKGG